MSFKEISHAQLTYNGFAGYGERWALLTAGDAQGYNTMTVSWGQLGVLWNRPAATVYVRPQRYTMEFMERAEYFSISFFDTEAYKEDLSILGSKSGRDGDKLAETGLVMVPLGPVMGFEQANMVLACRKLYAQNMEKPCFIDESVIASSYPTQDFHRMFVGEITGAWQRD